MDIMPLGMILLCVHGTIYLHFLMVLLFNLTQVISVLMLNKSSLIDTSNEDTYLSSTDFNIDTVSGMNTQSAHAFLSLPLVIQDQLLQSKRIVLIANNPSITVARLEQLLRPADMMVLFNDFIHAECLAHHPLIGKLPKLLFFRQIGDSKLHFGLPPRSNNLTAMTEMAKQAPLGLLVSNTSYQFPTPSDDPSPNDDPVTQDRTLTIPDALNVLFHSDEYCGVLSEQHDVVADYPCFADIHSSAPTSGFLLYRLLLTARMQVQTLQNTATPQPMLMIGFNNDNKTAHFWEGHNWAFERQELATPPDGVHIVRQY